MNQASEEVCNISDDRIEEGNKRLDCGNESLENGGEELIDGGKDIRDCLGKGGHVGGVPVVLTAGACLW
jgi:hypothetical protein